MAHHVPSKSQQFRFKVQRDPNKRAKLTKKHHTPKQYKRKEKYTNELIDTEAE